MKNLIKQRLKELDIKQSQFCQENGFDNSNFNKLYKRLGRNLDELKEFLDKLDLKIEIK